MISPERAITGATVRSPSRVHHRILYRTGTLATTFCDITFRLAQWDIPKDKEPTLPKCPICFPNE